MTNPCPVCAFAMPYPASDFHICPCCGTEFGYDDVGATHTELRADWLRGGAKWWSPVDQPPVAWDPYMQISNALYFSPSGVTSRKAPPKLSMYSASFYLGGQQASSSDGLARMASGQGGNSFVPASPLAA